MQEYNQWKRIWQATSVCAGLVIGLLLVACQPLPQQTMEGEPVTQIPEVFIEISESGIVVDDEIPGGIVHFSIHNAGTEPHAPYLWRIHPGHTRDEIREMMDYLQENPDDFFGVFELGSWIHQVEMNLLEPGDIYHFYADLGTGDFFMGDDKNPDVLIFLSAAEIVGITEPEATVKLEMVDFAYEMPDTIPEGKQLWEIVNNGEQWHIAVIASHNPDATVEELDAAIGGPDSPPPPDAAVEIFGGMPPMSEGERIWMEFDLEAGAYELLCPLPDMAAMIAGGPPVSHLMQGMRRAFTVTDSETAPITVVHTDDNLTIPESIPAGLRQITIQNDGEEWHASIFRRLKDDVTMEQFKAAFAENPFGSLPLTVQQGGPDLAPGTSSKNVFRFEPGNYVIVDNWTEPPRMQPFAVIAGSDSDDPIPTAVVTVEMREHEFVMPATAPNGPQWWQFHNTGEAVHQAGVAQLAEDKTIDDIIAWFDTEEGPPPWEDVAFWNVMSPGQQGWGELDLPPGDYLLLDYLPDFNHDGAPNFMLGMAQEFVVTE